MISNAKKIVIETDRTETLILRTGPRVHRFHCPECVQDVTMLDLNSAVTISGRGARDLIRDLEGGAIHSLQSSEGHLLICSRSLCGIFRDQIFKELSESVVSSSVKNTENLCYVEK